MVMGRLDDFLCKSFPGFLIIPISDSFTSYFFEHHQAECSEKLKLFRTWHRVLYVSDESLNSTPETNIAPYGN